MRFLSHPGPESDPNHHAGWPPLAKSLREGQKLLAAEGIALIVLHIPMKLRVLAPSIEPADWLRGRPEVVPPLEGPFAAALRLLCAELEVPFLDATPALAREAGAGPFIYQPFDTHLAARGHEIVAELLGPAVAEAL